jgi:hypothetical protein
MRRNRFPYLFCSVVVGSQKGVTWLQGLAPREDDLCIVNAAR